jgi:23S rRNA U2552 (ribose-2'-O)-methylase RlmE/FtsJ
MGWVGNLSAEETEIQKVPHQDQVDIIFDYHDVAHKEFVPEGRTVNVDFYKGVMDRLLKHIQRVRPAAFCS